MSTETKTLPQPRSFDFESMITLLVGPKEQRMTFHREFLGQDSKFFQAALRKERLADQSREIRLPEESPIHMGYYIEHGYVLAPPTYVFTEKPPSPTGHLFELLTELYVLGERRLDAKYQNRIMHEIFRITEVSKTAPGVDSVNAIFRGTTKKPPARRMVVDFAAECPSNYWSVDLDGYVTDADFWRDPCKVLLQRIVTYRLVSPVRGDSLRAKDYLVSEDAES